MSTSPSPDARSSKVSFVPSLSVADRRRGDSSRRINRKEAGLIVDEIERRLLSPELRGRSIGVITFNQPQQALIEDKLLERFATKPMLESIAGQMKEPIFVKNLENVQGDERDVILFSVTYAPDKDGIASMNFGPLNQRGGERRPNVAVSRARYEMVVFSSLRAEHIDLRRTNALGVAGLKGFLDFAERGLERLPLLSGMQRTGTGELIGSLHRKLSEEGYQIDEEVGSSLFRIDLAVRDPKQPERYLLGILCDGDSYTSARTARDREVVRPAVLGALGWRLHRVWSVDWLENEERTLGYILERLQRIECGEEEEPQVVTPSPVDLPIEGEETPLLQSEAVVWTKPYERLEPHHRLDVSDVEQLARQGTQLRLFLRELLLKEAPITLSFVYKRLVEYSDLGKVSSRLREVVYQALPDLEDLHQTSMDGTEVVLWIKAEDVDSFDYCRTYSDRDVQDIPLQELVNSLRGVLREQLSISEEELYKLASGVLGYARMGSRVRQRYAQALEALFASGEAERRADGFVHLSSI